MENRVGDHVPTQPELDRQVKTLDDLRAKNAGWTVKLDAQQRKQAPKPRTGAEPKVRMIARLAVKYGVDSTDTPVDGMLADLELADRVTPVAQAAALLAETYDDTRLQAEAEYWHAATALYALLRDRARNNQELAKELEDVSQFFALGKRRPKTPAPSPAK